jgi:hypothetical protein
VSGVLFVARLDGLTEDGELLVELATHVLVLRTLTGKHPDERLALRALLSLREVGSGRGLTETKGDVSVHLTAQESGGQMRHLGLRNSRLLQEFNAGIKSLGGLGTSDEQVGSLDEGILNVGQGTRNNRQGLQLGTVDTLEDAATVGTSETERRDGDELTVSIEGLGLGLDFHLQVIKLDIRVRRRKVDVGELKKEKIS